jgi:hypothetical protein
VVAIHAKQVASAGDFPGCDPGKILLVHDWKSFLLKTCYRYENYLSPSLKGLPACAGRWEVLLRVKDAPHFSPLKGGHAWKVL